MLTFTVFIETTVAVLDFAPALPGATTATMTAATTTTTATRMNRATTSATKTKRGDG